MQTLLTNLGIAMLFVALGIPLMLDKVRRNNFYGVRFRVTLADDGVWYAVNRLGGRMFVAGGAAAALVDLLALAGILAREISDDATIALVGYTLVMTFVLWCYAGQVARGRDIRGRDAEVGRTSPLLLAIGCFAVAAAGLLAAFSTPNPWLGFRVPATLGDPSVWHEINLRAGLALAILSTVFGFLSLGLRSSVESERRRLFPAILIGWLAVILLVTVTGTLMAGGLRR